MPPLRRSPSDAATLLDLLALVDHTEANVQRLMSTPPSTHEALVMALCPAGDYSTCATTAALLGDLGLGPGDIDANQVGDLVSSLALAFELEATILARAPAPRSSLVVTATGSPELAQLQRTLNFIPLFQLVEDVVRSATTSCWLGAPYWNSDAIERLRAALNGFARRGGAIEFVCQNSPEAGEADPLPVLCRAASDLAEEGGRPRVWTFTARSAEGKPLLLHAKFALADRRLGYLGSANMTRQGFGDHLEIGTRLPEVETTHLVNFLEALCGTGLLECHYP
jgi:phosphatidylserine/phosphatidylglycerophosphate/cardiolipin synthase-like enzyme